MTLTRLSVADVGKAARMVGTWNGRSLIGAFNLARRRYKLDAAERVIWDRIGDSDTVAYIADSDADAADEHARLVMTAMADRIGYPGWGCLEDDLSRVLSA